MGYLVVRTRSRDENSLCGCFFVRHALLNLLIELKKRFKSSLTEFLKV